jgi:sulfonate transport system substrate-binding protein
MSLHFLRNVCFNAHSGVLADALASSLALAVLFVANVLWAEPANARETVSIGYQRSSTLLILLKRTGDLEKRLNALGYDVSWHEFTNGLLESLNAGSVDLHADVI